MTPQGQGGVAAGHPAGGQTPNLKATEMKGCELSLGWFSSVSSCALGNLVVVFLLFWGTTGPSLSLMKVPRIRFQEPGVQSTACAVTLTVGWSWHDGTCFSKGLFPRLHWLQHLPVLSEGRNLPSSCSLPEMF